MITLLKNARILSFKNDEIIEGDIAVTDNKISFIGDHYEGQTPDRVIDCEKNLLMPGFKDAHAHTAMVFARSAADDLPLHDWLYETIFPMEAQFQSNDIYHLTKLGILEYLTSGITAAFDMYFNPPEIIRASEEMGFRTVILATSDSESISLLRERYLELNKEGSLISYQLGIHAEYTTKPERIKAVADLAKELHAPTFTHVGETESEVQGCVDRYGKTPLSYLVSQGFFANGGGAFHCNYFTDEEIELCKKLGIYVVTNPGSNVKLASGIAPLVKYQNAGVKLAIGTDGAASNNSLDMFKEMYLASVLQKVSRKDAAAMNGFDVLKMATVGSAHAMGLKDCDVLDVGKYADIIMIDLQNPAMQPIHNIAKNIVYAGSKDIVKMTMINGKVLYYDHKFYVDEPISSIYENAQRITDRLGKKQ
ncbi:MAG: amidohydrolase [Bacilli bacterium]|nr:amidohydrolase [Bacilli bacterium]